MVFDKKGLNEIVELFKDKYKINVEDIKGKYLKSEKLESSKYVTMNSCFKLRVLA